jgi:hypothetical protein
MLPFVRLDGLTIVISYSYRLNFIIAIIVEAYMKVVKKVAEQESDQEFVTDVVSTLYATTKSIAYNWVNRPQGSPCLVNARTPALHCSASAAGL